MYTNWKGIPQPLGVSRNKTYTCTPWNGECAAHYVSEHHRAFHCVYLVLVHLQKQKKIKDIIMYTMHIIYYTYYMLFTRMCTFMQTKPFTWAYLFFFFILCVVLYVPYIYIGKV